MPTAPKKKLRNRGDRATQILQQGDAVMSPIGVDEKVESLLGAEIKIPGIPLLVFNLWSIATFPIYLGWVAIAVWMFEQAHRLGIFEGPPYWNGRVGTDVAASDFALVAIGAGLILHGLVVPNLPGFKRAWLRKFILILAFPMPFGIVGAFNSVVRPAIVDGTQTIQIPFGVSSYGLFWQGWGFGQVVLLTLTCFGPIFVTLWVVGLIRGKLHK